jgi:hypothetical protein
MSNSNYDTKKMVGMKIGYMERKGHCIILVGEVGKAQA